MYSKSEIEDRNLAIATYELNYEILKTYLINLYNEKSKDENISFKKRIENLKIEEIENYTNYLRNFLDTFLDQINLID